MRGITLSSTIGIIGLLMVSQVVVFIPSVHSTRGTFSLVGTQIATHQDSCESGRIVVVHFSATIAPIEFFVIHSDFYEVGMTASLPNVSLCQYHIISQSANYQFITNQSGFWYLVFTNSQQFANTLQEQDIHYEWTDYSQEDWNSIQYQNWAIILSGLFVSAIIIIGIAKYRFPQK